MMISSSLMRAWIGERPKALALSWDAGRPQAEVGAVLGVRNRDSGPGLSPTCCVSLSGLTFLVGKMMELDLQFLRFSLLW